MTIMKSKAEGLMLKAKFVSAFSLWSLAFCFAANAAIQVLGVQYQQDVPYNEFDCIWNDKTYPTSCPPRALGCNVHVYLKNTGAGSVSITDVTLAGYSLEDSLRVDEGVHYARSIYFRWDNPPSDILNAGEPVWYKGDPSTIPPGGVAQAVIRLRRTPVTSTVAVGVQTSGGNVTTNITKDATAPQLASIGYSPDLTKVYLHWRRSGGAAPTTIRMDGTNATPISTTVGDAAMNFAATVINLPAPLSPMSYHVFQGVYDDGAIASASQRAWKNKYIYASYGNFELTANYSAADWVEEADNHGFNNVQVSVGGIGGYMYTAAGAADCRARGYGYTTGDKTKFNPIDPDMFFLEDEPDAEEANMESTFCGTGYKIPCGSSPMGILVMREIAKGEELRALRPMTPTNVNLDGTYRPENYYAWGQAMDVTQVDPYYQRRLSDVYWRDQYRIPLYRQADYIYAVSKATVTAAEPNPANILTFSCEWKCDDDGKCDPEYVGQVWPFPTIEAKRIEIYYALAAGAKGLGYWWFNKGYPSNGLADQNKATARALWKELGLLGNEIRTVAPWLVTGHPVDLPLTPSANVWAKALASRTDTLILFAVNDNYYNDESGCHYSNIPNATVTATLPTWMQGSPTAFEVSARGLSDVSTSLNGSQLQVNLGTLKLTKMIVITKDPQLRSVIQARYVSEVWPGICSFAPEECVSQTSPPVITQQPANVNAEPGDTSNFAIAASGSNPLSYQWQKNSNNIANGGHYSGCTTSTLTVAGADTSDAASYRCVVTNAYGTNISNPATLTLTSSSTPPGITQQPVNQNVTPGGTCSFTVLAAGSKPLSYQWQKSVVSGQWSVLLQGGHYSGCTTNLLTITSADASDAASYRCVVTNAYGSTNSSSASLTVISGCNPVTVANGDFEGANAGGLADGWTGYQRAPNPATVWSIQTNSPPAEGGLQYQQIANTSSTGGGGVRQDVTGCIAGATYAISGWMRGNSVSATCTVKCSPSASTDWSTALDFDPAQTYTGNTWTPFSGTVVAAASTITIWLDGQTGGSGLNKAECFDSVTMTCVAATVPPAILQQPLAQSVPAGGMASFTVLAGGSEPLSYQWQKSVVSGQWSVVLQGGHYSGATTNTLTIAGVDNNDVASYRCVVTNAYGITNSSAATLAIIIPNPCLGVLNSAFEGGFSVAGGGYVANNWTEWEATPGVIIGYDETGIVHGGAHSQRIRVSSTSATSGGVYQRVPATAGSAYAVSVWLYADNPLTACSLGVDPAGGTNASSGVTWSSASTNVTWVQKTWTGNATADYLTVYYRVSTPDSVKRNGYFDDGTPGGTSGAMQLLAQLNGNALTLTWPECPDARLERASNLSSPMNWATVTNQVSITGGQKSVTLTPVGSAGYFRLIEEFQ